MLVVHDRGDVHTPHAGAVAIAEAWPNAMLVSTEDLGHHRILRAPDVVAEAVDFLVEPAKTGKSPRPRERGRGDLLVDQVTLVIRTG